MHQLLRRLSQGKRKAVLATGDLIAMFILIAVAQYCNSKYSREAYLPITFTLSIYDLLFFTLFSPPLSSPRPQFSSTCHKPLFGTYNIADSEAVLKEVMLKLINLAVHVLLTTICKTRAEVEENMVLFDGKNSKCHAQFVGYYTLVAIF